MSSLDYMKQLTFFFIFDAEMLSWIGRTDASIKIADHQLLLLKSHIYKQCCWFHNILEILSNFIEILNMYGIKITWLDIYTSSYVYMVARGNYWSFI